jgi:3-oxoacyl-[acyl-carrier-protein] synthase-3
MMDTTDEWIVQRTGIRERRRADPSRNEFVHTLSAEALRRALRSSHLSPEDLDMIIVATVSSAMTCPSASCMVQGEIGAVNAGAMDIGAACSGFVFGLNVAHELIKGGGHHTVGVVGCDVLTPWMDYTTAGRGTAILFGDGGGAVVLKSTDDVERGLIAHTMRADGQRWADLYIPQRLEDFPERDEADPKLIDRMVMRGRDIFRFAVGAFPDLIGETLEKAGVQADEVDHYVCHQSNARILEAARQRFGLPEEKLYMNIDRIGNTSAGSVPICFDELMQAGRIEEGQLVMFVGFGGGLTWGSSLWRL